MLKRFIFFIVIAFTFFAFQFELSAGRFGGSFGGRSGFGGFGGGFSSGRSFAGSYGGGGFSRNYGGGGGFFFLPFGGYSSGATSTTGTIIGIAFAIVIAIMVYGFIKSKFSETRGYLPKEDYGVSFLSIAFSGSEKSIQEGLNKLAEKGKFGNREGEIYLFREATILMLRAINSVTHSFFDLTLSSHINKVRQKFESLSAEARSKLEAEGLRVDKGGKREYKEKPKEDFKAGEFIVVTLILAFRGIQFNTKEINSIDDLKNVLKTLSSVSEDSYMGMEVIWDPLQPEYSLTEDDMNSTYPELLQI